MENVEDSEPSIQELKKQFVGKSVVKQSDMGGDMQQEVVDIIASGIEQYSAPVFNVEVKDFLSFYYNVPDILTF